VTIGDRKAAGSDEELCMISFGKVRNAGVPAATAEPLDVQRVLCVAAIFSLATLPLLLCVALSIWG
jgi:hypothetical protein